jgi:hypothetical protein
MNVKKTTIMSLVMVLLIVSSIPWISIAGAFEYPPLPQLTVEVNGSWVDVILMGEGGVDLDGYWDINGLDMYMWFNPGVISAVSADVDPDGWYTQFWPGGVKTIRKIIGSDYVRVAFQGIPGAEGAHTPPSGQGRILTVQFDASVDPSTAEIYLLTPRLRRPKVVPLWNSGYFLTIPVGFPHPERSEAPWFNSPSGPYIPHVIELPYPVEIPPVAEFTVSDRTPSADEEVTFDAWGSYDPYGAAGHSNEPLVSYDWDFGDGTTGSGVTVTHTYGERGFYEATLTVTDNQGLTGSASLIMAVHPLQRAWPEHRRYSVSQDEDEYNDLTARVKNKGTATVDVRAKFSTFDPRTGLRMGPTLVATGTSTAGELLDLTVGWNPASFGWPGTKTRYEVIVELFHREGSKWIFSGSFRIVFKVVP